MITIIKICKFCGKEFIQNTKKERNYCDECSRSGKRHAAYYKAKRAADPALNVYDRYYKKLWIEMKNKRISKQYMDQKVHEANTHRMNYYEGKITLVQLYELLGMDERRNKSVAKYRNKDNKDTDTPSVIKTPPDFKRKLIMTEQLLLVVIDLTKELKSLQERLSLAEKQLEESLQYIRECKNAIA